MKQATDDALQLFLSHSEDPLAATPSRSGSEVCISQVIGRSRGAGLRGRITFARRRRACGTVLACQGKMTRLPDRQLLSYLASYDPHVANLTLALREVVLEEAPDAIESISRGYAVAIGFSFTGKPLKDGFCHRDL